MDENNLLPENKKYKFKELKVYASTEWLADNKKKYRQVFDRYETTYIYAELSFYNKWFDKDFWEADIELRCFSLIKSRKEVCNLSFRRRISKYDQLVFIREGWGNKKEGSFWKKERTIGRHGLMVRKSPQNTSTLKRQDSTKMTAPILMSNW